MSGHVPTPTSYMTRDEWNRIVAKVQQRPRPRRYREHWWEFWRPPIRCSCGFCGTPWWQCAAHGREPFRKNPGDVV